MVLQLLSEIVASALLGENRSWWFQIYVASYAQLLWIHSIFYQNTDYKSRLFYCASIRLFEQTGSPNTLHLSRTWGRNIYHRLLQTSSRIQPHWVKFTSKCSATFCLGVNSSYLRNGRTPRIMQREAPPCLSGLSCGTVASSALCTRHHSQPHT